MKIVRETSPYIRKDVSVRRMMVDVLIALLPVVAFSIIQFGWRAVVIICLALISMIGTEVLCLKIQYKKEFKEKFTVNNILVPAISALIFAMIMPSYGDIGMLCYSVFLCGALGIFVSKMVFGGTGSNIFNPAAVTKVLLTVCFSSVLVYTGQATFETFTGATALTVVKDGGLLAYKEALNTYSFIDLIVGNIPGCIGEVNSLAIFAGAIYLIIRKSADWRVMASTIISFTLIMLTTGVFYWHFVDDSLNPFAFTLFELLSGGLLFGAVFMATDPVTGPITKGGRLIYGFTIGALTAIMRLCSGLPEGVVYSILIANALCPAIDYYKWAKSKYTPNLFIGLLIALAIVIAVCGGAVVGKAFNTVGLIFLLSIIFVLGMLIFFNYLYRRRKSCLVKK